MGFCMTVPRELESLELFRTIPEIPIPEIPALRGDKPMG